MPYAYSVGDIFSKMENYIKTVHSDFEKVTRCLIENKVAKPKTEEQQE